MISLQIHHKTTYRFNKPVALGPHRLMLRPRENRDLRLISSHLTVTPEAVVKLTEGRALAGRYSHPRSPNAERSTPGGAYHPPER